MLEVSEKGRKALNVTGKDGSVLAPKPNNPDRRFNSVGSSPNASSHGRESSFQA
jgi:hypothetical protein